MSAIEIKRLRYALRLVITGTKIPNEYYTSKWHRLLLTPFFLLKPGHSICLLKHFELARVLHLQTFHVCQIRNTHLYTHCFHFHFFFSSRNSIFRFRGKCIQFQRNQDMCTILRLNFISFRICFSTYILNVLDCL